jgi:hypothetical protein
MTVFCVREKPLRDRLPLKETTASAVRPESFNYACGKLELMTRNFAFADGEFKFS